MKIVNKIYYVLFLFVGIVFSQDPPEGFEFEYTTQQGFYLFTDINILNEPLEEDDWIGAFHFYDETLSGECIQSEMNFDETLGGMCYSLDNNDYQCNNELFPDCNPEDCNESLDVDVTIILGQDYTSFAELNNFISANY